MGHDFYVRSNNGSAVCRRCGIVARPLVIFALRRRSGATAVLRVVSPRGELVPPYQVQCRPASGAEERSYGRE